MAKILSIFLVIILALPAAALADEPQQLEKIVVTPSRIPVEPRGSARSLTILDEEALDTTVYKALPDAIGEIGGIDVRRRGVEGVQADVSIRGTTFEQNTSLIDGVRMNDPQTGHFNMDLPLTMADVQKVEILKGPASSIYGPNAFGGVVNVVTKKPDGESFTASAEGGSYDYFDGILSVTAPAGPLRNRFSIEERRSTGYMAETEFDIFTLTDTATLDTAFGKYDFLFGYMFKDFGAANSYSDLYPNEQERTDTRLFKLGGDIETGPLKTAPKLYLRRHKDKFALDANRPGWQTNYHTVYDYGVELDFVFSNPFMDAAYGFEISRDTVDSTNLQTHSRTKDGIYLEISPRIVDKLYVNAGLREDYSGEFGWQCSPSVNARYNVSDQLAARGLIGRSYRIPTFTDLYYNDVANRGDSSLKPESSWSYEAGADLAAGNAGISGTFFHRDASDKIDWIRYSSRDPWRASNTGSSDTNGFELLLTAAVDKIYKGVPVKKAFFSYTTVDTYAKHDYLSKYAFDYLKQQISAGADCEIFGFRNSWVLNYKKRVGDTPYIVVDMKLSRDIVRKGKVVFEAFFAVENFFDAGYVEQSVRMPRRWIKSGGRVVF